MSLVGDEEGGSGQGHGHAHADATGGVLTDIDHVGIAVYDLDAAVGWYRDMFGATVAHRERIESDGVEEALIKVADSYIQLLTPVTDTSPLAKFMERNGEGLQPVKGARARVVDEHPRTGSRGTTVAFLHPKTSFATLIELVQE